MGYPVDSDKTGLARATYEAEHDAREFDIRPPPLGEDVVEVSDWRKRHPRANNRGGNIDRAAQAVADMLRERKHDIGR